MAAISIYKPAKPLISGIFTPATKKSGQIGCRLTTMPTKMSKSNFADNRVVKGKGKGKLKGKFKAEVKDIDWASLSAFEIDSS